VTVSDNGNVIVTRNSVTDTRRIIKIGMWVGHEKHRTQNTHKVKRSKVKVTRSCNVVAQKTSNVTSKRDSVVEVHLSYRKSRSPQRMAGCYELCSGKTMAIQMNTSL